MNSNKWGTLGKVGGACSVLTMVAVMITNYGDEFRTSIAGLEIIGNAEGYRREPYKCPADVLTVGVGSTAASGEPIEIGKIYSDDEIARRWKNDIVVAERCVTPAGIVHKGEYVLTKEATSRLGLDYLNYLNYGKRGFATGGGVAVPRVPNSYKPAQTGGTNNQVSISINIDQNGNAESDVSQTAQQSKQLAKMIEKKVLDVLVQQKRSGNLLA